MAVVSKNAAILCKESELDKFQNKLEVLINDEKKQTELSKNMKLLALPNATNDIVNEIENLI